VWIAAHSNDITCDAPPINEWHHMVVVHNSTNTTAYINGQIHTDGAGFCQVATDFSFQIFSTH